MRRLVTLALLVATTAVVGMLAKIHAVANGYDLTESFRAPSTVLYILSLGAAAYAVGLPDLPRTRRSRWGAALCAVAVVALGFSAVQLVLGRLLLPRFVVFGSALVLAPVYTLLSTLAADGRRVHEDRDRVLLVAEIGAAADLAEDLSGSPERFASLVASLTPDDVGPGQLGLILAETGATVLVLDRAAQLDEGVVGQAAALHLMGVRIRTLNLFYEEWLGKLPVSELERVSLMFDIGELHRLRYGRLKRLVDLGVALFGMVALALVIPVVVVGNVAGNRGPLWYHQPRVGRAGREFRIVKFRTMREQPGERTTWTIAGDPRVTRFGALLRRSHLDELPQMWNILRGDLSIVGPRPEQPTYVAELREKLPFYDMRHLVRPGLTGWAQVKYPYGADERDALEKLQFEFFYLRRQSLGLDLRIIGRTARTVLRGAGR